MAGMRPEAADQAGWRSIHALADRYAQHTRVSTPAADQQGPTLSGIHGPNLAAGKRTLRRYAEQAHRGRTPIGAV